MNFKILQGPNNEHCDFEAVSYLKKDGVGKLCKFVFALQKTCSKSTFKAHNSKGYDSQFIVNWLLASGV